MTTEQRLFLDIHAIQTLPPSNMNRDDTGSPKTAQYGGVRRSRVSSQSWKKAMREYFNTHGDQSNVGIRTKEIVRYVADKIVELTDGFTGADLESTVRDLAYRSIANSNFVLNEENMITAFNNVVPLSQTSPEKIEAIRDWGKERAVPASGKPIGGEELSQKKSGLKTRKVLV